tara:strand:+ start:2689 stop:3198 length:510 start_codon:yes stop_codon:yes gene_type:complete
MITFEEVLRNLKNTPEFSTLAEARLAVLENRDKGMICPCCDKFTRAYRRNFNSTMSRSLIWLVKIWEAENPWVDVPKNAPRWLVRSNQLPSVRWWDLIERCPNDNPEVKHSGLWRPTQKGLEFVYKRTKIPSKALTYDGKVIALEGDMVTIEDTLGTKFHYAELMGDQG